MNLIQISNQYSINLEKYAKIKAGDIIKSQSQLRQMLCYPEITPTKANSGTIKALQPIIDTFIKYEPISGNGYKIRITATEPPQRIKEISENYLQSHKTKESRIFYRHNRKYLLDYITHSYTESPFYLTTYEIIQQSTIYQDFFYNFNDIRYDKHFPTTDESKKLDEFATEYVISDKEYLVTIMEALNNILYRIFNGNNITSWADTQGITAERVLYRNNEEADENESKYLENYYLQPQRDKGVPAKSVIKLANKRYMKDYDIPLKEHKWFYYSYKFTKPDTFNVKVDDRDFIHNQHELSNKALEALRATIFDTIDPINHAIDAKSFEEIISKIKIGRISYNQKII